MRLRVKVKENPEGRKRKAVHGKEKRKNKFCLHYNFPIAFVSWHIHIFCMGFTKRMFTGGVKKMFKFWTLRLKFHKEFSFTPSKANINIFVIIKNTYKKRGPFSIHCLVSQ